MSVGWSYSPTWTGQRGGDWSQPVRRQLRLPAQNVEWSHSSGLKREVDWPNSLKRRVAWPFSRQPGSSGRDWDNLVGGQRDSPQTFTSKVGGQKYVTDQVGQREKSKRCCTPVYMHVAQAAALWAAAQQYSSVRPSWWKAAVEARSRERRRRLRRFFLLMKITFFFLSTRWRQRQWRLRQRAENRCRSIQIFLEQLKGHQTFDVDFLQVCVCLCVRERACVRACVRTLPRTSVLDV